MTFSPIGGKKGDVLGPVVSISTDRGRAKAYAEAHHGGVGVMAKGKMEIAVEYCVA